MLGEAGAEKLRKSQELWQRYARVVDSFLDGNRGLPDRDLVEWNRGLPCKTLFWRNELNRYPVGVFFNFLLDTNSDQLQICLTGSTVVGFGKYGYAHLSSNLLEIPLPITESDFFTRVDDMYAIQSSKVFRFLCSDHGQVPLRINS